MAVIRFRNANARTAALANLVQLPEQQPYEIIYECHDKNDEYFGRPEECTSRAGVAVIDAVSSDRAEGYIYAILRELVYDSQSHIPVDPFTSPTGAVLGQCVMHRVLSLLDYQSLTMLCYTSTSFSALGESIAPELVCRLIGFPVPNNVHHGSMLPPHYGWLRLLRDCCTTGLVCSPSLFSFHSGQIHVHHNTWPGCVVRSNQDCVALAPYTSIWRDLTQENTNFVPTPGYTGSCEAFSVDDVAIVLALTTSVMEDAYCCGGSSAQAICILADGQLAALHLIDEDASCSSGGEMFTAQFSDSLLGLVSFGLDTRQRQALGLKTGNKHDRTVCENNPFASFAVVEEPCDDELCHYRNMWGYCHDRAKWGRGPPCQNLGNGWHVHYQHNHKSYRDGCPFPYGGPLTYLNGERYNSYTPWKDICAGLDVELRYESVDIDCEPKLRQRFGQSVLYSRRRRH